MIDRFCRVRSADYPCIVYTMAKTPKNHRRGKEYMTVFINGKQKRIRRPPTIEGLPVDEFIRCNADPTWLQANEMWELMENTSDAKPPNS